MKLRDFKGLFKSSVLTFNKAENIGEDIYQVHLDKPMNLSWRPGEHGIFTIKGKKVKGRKWHAFSVASIKEEEEIILGTRTGEKISSYKDALLHMEKGDKVKIRGPFGWFVFEDDAPVVMIALGVGITPVRSLLMSVKGKNKPVDLIYSSKSTFLFKSDIDEIAKESKHIDVHYLDNHLETSNMIVKKAKALENSVKYYISGNPKSIKTIKKLLKTEGIKSKNIVHDPFFGY